MATPESRVTIMSDFATEKIAIKVMQDYFQNTEAYYFYCRRIMREWVDRIAINEKLLKNSDIKLIINFLVGITDDFLNEKDILVKKFQPTKTT